MANKGSNYLQEELRRFREQQANAQARVANAKAKPKAKPKPKVKAEATPGTGPAEERKPHWTELVAQAQAAPDKRHVPQAIGLKLKRLLDTLLEEDKPLTAQELKDATDINLLADTELLHALKTNPKAKFDEATGAFTYQSKYNVRCEADLLALCDKHPEGLLLSDLKDSYKLVMEDLKACAARERLWLLTNTDNKEELVYPVDPKLVVHTDADIVQLWRDEPVPENDDDLLQEMHKVGLKPCSRQAGPNSKRPEKEQRKEKSRKLRSVQNVHVAHIFSDAMAGGDAGGASKKRKER